MSGIAFAFIALVCIAGYALSLVVIGTARLAKGGPL